MKRLLAVLMGVLFLANTGMVFADEDHPVKEDTKQVRHDRKDLRKNKRERRKDTRELKKDVMSGNKEIGRASCRERVCQYV